MSTTPCTRIDGGIEYRAMRADDVEAAWALSMEQNWPHRPQDWETALALGEGFVATLDGKVIGTSLRWIWGPGHATIGLLIVASFMRGRRIGTELMHQTLAGMENRTISLYATELGRGIYERLGFERIGEIRQHQAVARTAPVVALEPGWRLRPYQKYDELNLMNMDLAARGWQRLELLKLWIESAEQVVVLDKAGEFGGYAILRRFGKGVTIGPVVACNQTGARALISHLVSAAAGRFTRIDVDFSCGLTSWIEEIRLPRTSMVTSMVRGPMSSAPSAASLFAVATQSLG
jgi:ribosomal protein S18 acetylase RimI-like enzyme